MHDRVDRRWVFTLQELIATWTAELPAHICARPQATKRKHTSTQALGFLKNLLVDGPLKATMIAECGAAHGYTAHQLRYAREKLKIEPQRRSGFAGKGDWWWGLPQEEAD
jgi:hypothetical protein